jgi:hypothetical protein
MTAYRIDRRAVQRADRTSSYPQVTWTVVRCSDERAIVSCKTKKEAQRAIDLLVPQPLTLILDR